MLTNYSKTRAHKLLKRPLPDIREPYNIKILWIQAQSNIESETYNSGRARHQHSFYEAHFIISGSMIYATDSDRYELNEGNVIIFPPQVHHRRTNLSENSMRVSIAFIISASTPCTRAYEYDGNVLAAIDSIFKEADNFDELSDVIICNSVICSLSDYLREIHPVKRSLEEQNDMLTDEDQDIRIVRAKTFIEDNKGSFLDCNSVARHCHFNVKYLNRIFKEQTGISLLEYIHTVRTTEAERLLEDSNYSIEQISGLLGFSNVQYFNTFFKRRTGISPVKYRKLKFKL